MTLFLIAGTSTAHSTRAKLLAEEMSALTEGIEQEKNELALKLNKIRSVCQAALEQEDADPTIGQILALIDGSSD